MNSQGRMLWLVTLESNDTDQPLFAKEHPEQASKGVRRFSLDGYSQTEVNSNGQGAWSHSTYRFFDGEPSYDTVRDEFVKIATGKSASLSNRANIVVP